jgi:hypothetical protein
MQIFLETERLVLRRFTEADVEELFELDSAAAAQPLAEAALAGMRVLGPDVEIARALIVLGDTVQTRGDVATARRLLDEAVAVSRRAGATVELVDALHYLGGDALAAGEDDRARARADECLTLARQAGYRRGVARALRALGSIASIELDGVAARLHLEASIAAANEVGDRWETAQAAYRLGHLAADEGQHTAAVSLFGHLRELGRQLGMPRSCARSWKVPRIRPSRWANPSGRCGWPGWPQPSARPSTRSSSPCWGVSSSTGLRQPAARWAASGRPQRSPPVGRCRVSRPWPMHPSEIRAGRRMMPGTCCAARLSRAGACGLRARCAWPRRAHGPRLANEGPRVSTGADERRLASFNGPHREPAPSAEEQQGVETRPWTGAPLLSTAATPW